MGRAPCYWCGYWVYNPYIIEYIDRPLCNWCFDWHTDFDGGPYEPTAQQRCCVVVARWFPGLPPDACSLIAEGLCSPYEP